MKLAKTAGQTGQSNGRRGREAGAVRKELVFAVVLAITFVSIVLFAVLSRRSSENRIIREGDVPPAFTLRTTQQSPLTLTDFRGKVVLVHFWATWCPPCVEEMPQLERLYHDLKGPDFEILAVNVDEDAAASVTPFLTRSRVSFPVLFDPGGVVARRYGTVKFPETYVLDRGGTVRFKVIGPLQWTAAETITALRRLISER